MNNFIYFIDYQTFVIKNPATEVKEAKTGAKNTQTFLISTGIDNLCNAQQIIAEVDINPTKRKIIKKK